MSRYSKLSRNEDVGIDEEAKLSSKPDIKRPRRLTKVEAAAKRLQASRGIPENFAPDKAWIEDALSHTHVFVSDFRSTNPSLHMLYVTQHIVHLRAIDNTLRKLHNFSNTSLFEVIAALYRERAVLIYEDAAFAHAATILLSLGLESSTSIVDDNGDCVEVF